MRRGITPSARAQASSSSADELAARAGDGIRVVGQHEAEVLVQRGEPELPVVPLRALPRAVARERRGRASAGRPERGRAMPSPA